MRYRAGLPMLTTGLLSLTLAAFALASEPAKTRNKALVKTHNKLVQTYVDVPHISPQTLSEMDAARYVIFDVREADEFAVSHLKNAIWIDPDMSPEAFYSQYGELVSGKTVILYCSVGVRSTRLASRLLSSQREGEQTPIYNLETGIFGWHNESRPLTAQSHPTDFVHPYNRRWGRMVNRKNLRRYDERGNPDE